MSRFHEKAKNLLQAVIFFRANSILHGNPPKCLSKTLHILFSFFKLPGGVGSFSGGGVGGLIGVGGFGCLSL